MHHIASDSISFTVISYFKTLLAHFVAVPFPHNTLRLKLLCGSGTLCPDLRVFFYDLSSECEDVA